MCTLKPHRTLVGLFELKTCSDFRDSLMKSSCALLCCPCRLSDFSGFFFQFYYLSSILALVNKCTQPTNSEANLGR